MAERFEIAFSKPKLLGLFLLCLLFVAAGWLLVSLSDAEIRSQVRFNSPPLTHAVGLACLVLFGAVSVFPAMKLFDSTPGLVFDEDGITDNSNMFSLGFIAWEDITGLEVRQLKKQRFVYLLLRDPEKYISRCNVFKRALLRLNSKLGPSPVAISSNSLDATLDDLVSLLSGHLSRRKNA